jgi:ribosomal protein S18 acetylase RimI-like enzyme
VVCRPTERALAERQSDIGLRRTELRDLDFVLALERHPENSPFIGSWSKEEHQAAMGSSDREHWLIEHGHPAGYLISYDLRAMGFGVYAKRIVVASKSRGVGRVGLDRFLDHAFTDLAAPFVWLSVFADNARARRCYEALGFRERSFAAAERAAHHAAAGGFSERSLLMFVHRAGSPE